MICIIVLLFSHIQIYSEEVNLHENTKMSYTFWCRKPFNKKNIIIKRIIFTTTSVTGMVMCSNEKNVELGLYMFLGGFLLNFVDAYIELRKFKLDLERPYVDEIYDIDNKISSTFILCSAAEGIGWNSSQKYQIKLKFNSCSDTQVFQIRSFDSISPKPIWDLQLKMGLSKNSFFGINYFGRYTINRGNPENVKTELNGGGSFWYRNILWREKDLWPAGSFGIFLSPSHFLDFTISHNEYFIKYTIGAEITLAGGENIIFPVPNSFFTGVSLDIYKNIKFLLEYKGKPQWATGGEQNEPGYIATTGLNYQIDPKLNIGLDYAIIYLGGVRALYTRELEKYNRRVGTHFIFDF